MFLSRLERFREIRRFRRICFSSFLLALILLAAGICVADYSVTDLMQDKKGINIVSVERREESLEINVLNCRINLNTKYINRDFEKIKSAVGKFITGR